MKNYVSKIYGDREEFIIIGLTGKTGSGCTTVSKILENGYKDYHEINCNDKPIQNRKDSIIKAFASKAFSSEIYYKKFKVIKPSTLMMMLFIFEKQILFGKIKALKKLLDKTDIEIKNLDKKNLKKFKTDLKKELKDLKELYKIIINFQEDEEVNNFEGFEKNFDEKKDYIKNKNRKSLLTYIDKKKNEYEKKLFLQDKLTLLKEINKLFNCELSMPEFDKIKYIEQYEVIKDSVNKEKIKEKIELKRKIIDCVLTYLANNKSKKFIYLYESYNKKIIKKRENKELSIQQLQSIGDLVREQIDIFQLPNYTNLLIKAFRTTSKEKDESCYIVIDSLKNPFEILFFKERYSAYYTFSIHAKDEIIYKRVVEDKIDIEAIHKKELNLDEKGKQKGSLDSKKDFNSQNVIECTQRSDIYIDNNKDKKDTLYKQIFKYLSLIIHPGLVTPSKDEMIMQVALNAKFNSGCISRQVGAVVLNKFDSVKAIGWNEVPEGQMPCLLRSHSELLDNSSSIDYSKYEKNTVRNKNQFKYVYFKKEDIKDKNKFKVLSAKYTPKNQYDESNKKGLNDSFCFKSIQNNIDGNKNQVYTRSLHAEENAFLQASKYGNSEIIGGQLFTTASPCFLCAKKAYQLGMKRIVYIEAYPDISNEQVFDIGIHDIEMVHFRGAIGLAYQKLYEPIFSYKDELQALNRKLEDK
jgi:deoxycytidylate deaminase